MTAGLSRALTLTLVLALAGCATAPQRSAPAKYSDHQRAVRAVEDWSLLARAAINTADDSASVNLHWRQRPDSYRLTLRAPLGAGTLRLEGDDRSTTLRASDGTRATAASPEALLRGQTGMELPVSNLRYWIRGVPAPAPAPPAETRTNGAGRLSRLRQSGWTVRYSGYGATEPPLPTQMRLRGDGVEIRIAVLQWDLRP